MGVLYKHLIPVNSEIKRKVFQKAFSTLNATNSGYYSMTESQRLNLENQELKKILADVGLFLHQLWCDAQLNDYSFQKLNDQLDSIDRVLKNEIL